MRLTVSGNINEYYVQTLCLLFFPNERFSKTRDDAPDAPVADVLLTESDGFAHAEVSLSHGGKSVIRLSYIIRLLVLAGLLFAFYKSGLVDPFALVIPLLFVRIIILLKSFFGKGHKQ